MVILLTQLFMHSQQAALTISSVHYCRRITCQLKQHVSAPIVNYCFQTSVVLSFIYVDDSHRQIDHHPLRSSHYIDSALLLNQDGYSDGAINDYNDDNSLASIFSADSSMTSDDFDNADQFVNDYEEAQQQQSLRNAIS